MNRPLIAERFLQPEENLLMEIATLAKKTPNLIDLSIGDPDLITDATIIEAAFADVKAGHTKYTASDGSADFIQTVVDFYQKQYQLTFSPSQVRGTVGALHGMYLALAAIIDPGDEVIIHEPYFSPYKQQVELVGGVPVFIPTFEKDGFQIDVEVLKAAITEKTRAIIINSPNTITFSSFSKAFAMTGWRIGYMIAPESINLTAKLINEAIAYSAPTPSQRAGIYALNHYDTLVPQVVAVFKERLTYIEQRVAEIPFLSLSPVKGSMYHRA